MAEEENSIKDSIYNTHDLVCGEISLEIVMFNTTSEVSRLGKRPGVRVVKDTTALARDATIQYLTRKACKARFRRK